MCRYPSLNANATASRTAPGSAFHVPDSQNGMEPIGHSPRPMAGILAPVLSLKCVETDKDIKVGVVNDTRRLLCMSALTYIHHI